MTKVIEYLKSSVSSDRLKNLHFAYDHKKTLNGREYYVVHVYESNPYNIATFNWYDVDIMTGKVIPEF